MKARYTAVYKFRGASGLPAGSKRIVLAESQDPALTAVLTTDPEEGLLHARRSAAIGGLLVRSLFGPAPQGSPEERAAQALEDVRAHWAREIGGGVFLVFHGQVEIPTPKFGTRRRDLADFGVSLDTIDTEQVRGPLAIPIRQVLTGVGLSLPQDADRHVERVADAVHLVDLVNGKPIYVLTSKASGSLTVSSPLLPSHTTEAASLTTALVSHTELDRVCRNLVGSMDPAVDDLEAFTAAWSALELFVHGTFEREYKGRLLALGDDLPVKAIPMLNRVREGKSAKVDGKFVVLAMVLDRAAALDDTAEFDRLYEVRNALQHEFEWPATPLPVEATQRLLMKYLKLHLRGR